MTDMTTKLILLSIEFNSPKEERDQQFEQRYQAYSNENHNEDVYITIAHEIPHEVYITAEL